MRPVRLDRVNFPEQGHRPQHGPLRMLPVGAAVDKGQTDFPGGGAEQDYHGMHQPLVQLPGKGGVAAAGIGLPAQFHGGKEETLRVASVKPVGLEQAGLLRPGNFIVGQLKKQVDGFGFPQEIPLGFGIRVRRIKLPEKFGRVSRLAGYSARAAVAQGVQ